VKPFTTLAVVVFALVALLQLVRVSMGWVITVNGNTIPLWASVVVAVLAATLSVMLRREAQT